MKRVGGPQRRSRQAEPDVFCSAVYVTGQLDAVIHTLVETREDRVLKPACGLASV